MQSLNADCPMFVNEDGIMICFRFEQPEKAQSSIVVTDKGMNILTSEMHPEKALALIDVTDGGIEIFLSKTQLLSSQKVSN